MAKTSFGNTDIYKVSVGDLYNITKISIGDKLVYTAGNIVTYHVDKDVVYTEEVDADETVLSPKTFVPTKSGWVFHGWRQDVSANGTIINQLVMGDEPITLYAVFKQTITLTYYNGNTTKKTATGQRYYNNTGILNPTFTINQAAVTGFTPIGWSTGTTGNAAISYTKLSNTGFDKNTTLYGMYNQTITLTLYNGSKTATKQTGTRYFNSGTNVYVNPTFTVTPTTVSGFTFRGWSTSATANAQTQYTTLNKQAFAANTTLYALYQQTIKLSYNAGGGSGSMAAQTNTRYYSSNGTYVNPSFKVAANGFTRAGYTFNQWRRDSTSGATVNAGATLSLNKNATLYAAWTYVGAPYYLIQNGTVKQAMVWKRGTLTQYISNAPETLNWAVNSANNKVSAHKEAGSIGGEPAAYVDYTYTLSPKGNKTLRLEGYHNTSGYPYAFINNDSANKQRIEYGNGINITLPETSTVSFTIRLESHSGYAESLYYQPYTIRLL